MAENNQKKPLCSDVLAGDLQKGWDSTDRLLDRIESYSTLKDRTLEFYDWGMDGGIPQFNRDQTKIFRQLNKCGSYLIFRSYLRSHVTRLIGSCSCKQHLLCAFCASRRGVRNAVSYKEKVDQLLSDLPGQRLMLLTFTVKNGADLWERFQHLRSSMQSFLQRRNDSLRRNTPSSFHSVNGGVFAYEFKRGSGEGNWHPHIHMLALVDYGVFLDAGSIKDEWFAITGDSSVVNLAIANDNAFLEVFAYALKFSEMAHPDRWYAFNKLRSERLISSFGSFRGVEVPDTANDDVLASDEPWVDLLFKFYRNRGYDTKNPLQLDKGGLGWLEKPLEAA